MAASSDVAAFRAAGHSVASTASHFGISERAVYKACQAQAARLRRGVARVTSSRSVRSGSDDLPAYAPLDDTIAGHCTYWRCPTTDDFLRVPPGARRLDWMNERRALHAPLPASSSAPVEVEPVTSSVLVEVETPAFVPTPVPTPEPVFMALQREIEPIEPVLVLLPMKPASLHNQVSFDWSLFAPASAWMMEYWRVPLALVAALILILLCR